MEQALDLYKDSTNPALFKARQEKFNRDLKVEINENASKWGMNDDQMTSLLVQASDYAFSQVLEQLVLELYVKNQEN